jgi:S1-C subfamily serine protease
MSFLDDVPQVWARPFLPALRDLLVHAYPRPAAAEALADAAGLEPGTFPYRDNMRLTWTALIQELGNQRRLRRLVELAAADATVAVYRPRLEEMLGESPAVPAPSPLPASGSWWKGDDRAPGAAARLRLERLLDSRSRLIRIELAAEVVSAARSVAKLSVTFAGQAAHGTGFLISPDRVLTNYHNVAHATYGRAIGVVAEFDYDLGEHDSPLVRRALVDTIVGDPDDDWAVLTLAAPVNRPPLRLGTPFDIGSNDLVVFIQHPQGGFKQFSLEPLAIRYRDDRVIQYLADTQHGSSGSPVFNQRMQVIALHQAEAEARGEVGGTGVAADETARHNQGVRITRVTAGLAARGIGYIDSSGNTA